MSSEQKGLLFEKPEQKGGDDGVKALDDRRSSREDFGKESEEKNQLGSSEEKETVVTVYHYTDKESYEKIKKSGRIMKSTEKESTVFGEGTYVTQMSPLKNTKWAIVENNYDIKVVENNYDIRCVNNTSDRYYDNKDATAKGHTTSDRYQKKADIAIKLRVPRERVQKVAAGSRDVHKIEGDIEFDPAELSS